MSTSLSNILANDARQKARLLVSKVLPKGVYGDVDAGDVLAFRVEENTSDNVNKVLVRKGTVLAAPDLIVWSDNDIVLDVPAPDPLVDRYDVIYIDAVADTGEPDIKIATGTMSVPAPVDPANHTHVPIWRIKRLANTPAVTYAACIQDPGAGDEPGKDMREKPPSEPHNHQLLAGATDVSATAAEINLIADGIRAAASAGRLSDLAESNATKAQLNELVGGASTILHSHNSANSIQTPAGVATPLAGVINFALTQNGSTSDISASGNTVLFNVAGDDLGDHTATQDLNMATHKVINVGDPTDNQDAATKKYVDDEINGGLNGYAKYNAEQDFDLNPTAAPVGKRIHNLEDGAVEKDAINKGQLDEAINGLGGSLANLDERYKLGLPGGPVDPNASNYHLNNKAYGNIDLQDYKVQNSGTISKVTDLPKTLVNKQYVDDEIAEAVEDLEAQINGFFKNPAETDLIMTGPNGQKTIVALKNPAASDHAANKAYVDARINHVISLIPTEPGQQPEGDNLGNHTATMDLDMANNAIQGVVMPGQDPLELSINDRLAVNRKFVVDVFNGIPQPDIPVTDLTGFAKIGTNFETAKNLSPLNMSVAEGGEVNVRGTDGRGLLVIKKKPDAPGEDVFINSRIQGVEDPTDNQDAATKKYVDSKLSIPSQVDITEGYIIITFRYYFNGSAWARDLSVRDYKLPSGFTIPNYNTVSPIYNSGTSYGYINKFDMKIVCSRSDYYAKWSFESNFNFLSDYSIFKRSNQRVNLYPSKYSNVVHPITPKTNRPGSTTTYVPHDIDEIGYLNWCKDRTENHATISCVGIVFEYPVFHGGAEGEVIDIFDITQVIPPEFTYTINIKMKPIA